MEEKEVYTIEELYDELTITLVELATRADLNEVTVARIRDGKPTRRTSINRLLQVLSTHFGKRLSLANVTGITVQTNKRLENRKAKRQEEQASHSSSAA